VHQNQQIQQLSETASKKQTNTLIALLLIIVSIFLFNPTKTSWFKNNPPETNGLYAPIDKKETPTDSVPEKPWKAADINLIKDPALKKEVTYGRNLIAHTAKYLGPNGSVKKITNGMNCNNCHLDAGTRPWGNNYGSVKSTYPKMRSRSGQIEDLNKRINDCLQRSLNGQPLLETDREMKAMIAYIEYIGKDVPKGDQANNSGIYDLKYLDRAADPIKGQSLYTAKCMACHQANGQGILAVDKKEYTYPPLWGKNAYNQGAGLYRLSRFAGYIKYNMPFGASFAYPLLSDEEAWDLAAYVNSQPRPTKDFSQDWPDISKKHNDHPFGPFSDKFSEEQHKFGPFKPIAEAHPKKK